MNEIRVPELQFVFWETTVACNLECIHCRRLEIGQLLSEARSNIMTEWPITNLGASLKAESIEEVRNCLKRILVGDTAAMLQAQQKYFQADGLNGERVAQAVLNYYKR